jgi:hypothetical protein
VEGVNADNALVKLPDPFQKQDIKVCHEPAVRKIECAFL